MADSVEIQDIEGMRQKEGIDDVELREEVRRLRVGDLVKLTFVTGPRCETLPVRITRIRGEQFRGQLVAAPSSDLSGLKAGFSVAFTRTHIHSVLKRCVRSE